MVIRAATPDDVPAIARVHVDSWRTTYRGLLPDKVLADLSSKRRQADWQQRIEAKAAEASSGCVFVAEVAGELVGFASAGPNREEDSRYGAELYAIYILQEHQRRGIGRSITSRVLQELRTHGHDSMLVWVLKGNPAETFYRRLGGKLTGEKVVNIGDEDYLEVSYGWKDLKEFGLSAESP